MKNELDHVSAKNIITSVQQTTDWVSHVVVTMKQSGGLRVCLDPQELNKALKRKHFKLPTLMIFYRTILILNCFLLLMYVLLDEESCFPTTFSTPNGRYRWVLMLFGCNGSSEIFQK